MQPKVAHRMGGAHRRTVSVQGGAAMVAVDVYRAAQWHDFFVMVGTGAAALTGLVFVAMSLNVAAITQDATHRYRAVGNLTGLTASSGRNERV